MPDHHTSRLRPGRMFSSVAERFRSEGWTILQRAAAGVIAFVLARWIGDHPDVFFAPIAAIVALNTEVGDRGINALKLLLGVFTGIIIGELSMLVIGHQVAALGVAALLAIGVASLAGGSRLTIAQAAASAVLTIAVAGGGSGWERLADALVGAVVALVFTQVLFPPNPLRLLHRAETEALLALAFGLSAAADALRDGDNAAGRAALLNLRKTRDELADIAKARQRSRSVTRHTLTRRGSSQPVVAENENAAFLDVLGDGCVLTVRLGLDGGREQQAQLADPLGVMARFLRQLADSPSDRGRRQRVVDEIPDLLEQLRGLDVVLEDSADTATRLTRLLAHDIMRYAGVPADNARLVMEQDATEAEVSDQTPQSTWLTNMRHSLANGAKSVADRVQRLLRPGQDQDPDGS